MCRCRWILILLLAGGAACHEEGSVAVSSLSFDGNSAFPDDQLRAVLATKQSGWLPWSPRHYFDRAEFEADTRERDRADDVAAVEANGSSRGPASRNQSTATRPRAAAF